MKSVFALQWVRFRRSPFTVISFLVLTIVFVSLMAGNNPGSIGTIQAFTDPSMTDEEAANWIALLNESGEVAFELADEEEIRKEVSEGDVPLAVRLLKDDYRIVIAADDASRFAVDSYMSRIYREELGIRALEEGRAEELREKVQEGMEEPALGLKRSVLGEEKDFQYDNQLQLLFGMSLFFSVYTIMFSIMKLVEEKRNGTWDRLILSPLRKWQIYLGHMAYSFLIGYVQIVLVFLLFKFVFNFEVGDRFGVLLIITACYTLAIVAMSMLVMGLVTRPQQLQAVVPIIATGMAMIGGAFWPIELVENDFLIAISKFLPITYGLEALKGVAIYNHSWSELLEPLAFLLLIAVVCMGIGINLMERRKA